MSATMTLEQIISSGAKIYPDGTPQTLKATIEDWFCDRNVFNDTDFPRYFRRELANDLPRYLEMMQLQPGMLKVDWFVEEYRETKSEHNGSHSNSNNSSSRTDYGKVVQDNSSNTHTGTNEQDHTQDAANNYDQAETSGQQVYGKTQEQESSGTNSSTADSQTLLKQGSKDGHREISKQTPQSALYSGAAAGQIPSLSWQTASAQAQTEDTHTPTGEEPDTNHSEQSASSGQKTTAKDGGQDSNSGSEKRYFNRNDINKTIYNEGNTSSHHIEDSGDDRTTNQGTDSGTENGEDTSMVTGRHQLPAEVVRQAVSVIKNTNAWEWLMEQLEPYFIGVWEI